jgi:hypothetical protein
MAQFLYILSNPSMPGLIKVGKTTTSPDQRMSELHSTGVPTPFILELSIEVVDCHRSERAAHHAIAKARLARDREFFRISVADALKQILPTLGQYKILEARASYGIDAIERDLERKREEKKQREEISRLNEERVARELAAKHSAINAAIAKEQLNIDRLGARPTKRELPMILTFAFFAYWPIPIGWMFWLGAFQVFEPKHEDVGIGCIIIIVLGYLASLVDKDYQKTFEEAHRPFDEIDRRITKLKADLETR